MPVCGVYTITNTLNGKIYVGSSVDVFKRFRNHKSYLRRGVHSSAHLQSAWGFYGQEAFKFSVVEETLREDVRAREQHWIGRTACCDRRFGYNTAPTAEPGLEISEETRAKMRAAKLGKHRPPHSEATKEKIRLSNLGLKRSAETRARVAAARRGKPRSAETRARVSRAVTARWALLRSGGSTYA